MGRIERIRIHGKASWPLILAQVHDDRRRQQKKAVDTKKWVYREKRGTK
jgi:hypothetical protein